MVRVLAPRPTTLTGTVGVIDISKPRGDVFCDELEILLHKQFPAVNVIRLRKPTFTKPSPRDFRLEIIRRCSGVIQALAD
jgi:hypothetical protein|tara:strand:+ start:170 stop:409 length:240 start_codon:yes stop_codon:yes gene_type:complete